MATEIFSIAHLLLRLFRAHSPFVMVAHKWPANRPQPPSLLSFLACFGDEHVIFKWAGAGEEGGLGSAGGGIALSGAECGRHEVEIPAKPCRLSLNSATIQTPLR